MMIIPFNCNKVRVTSPYGSRVLNGQKQYHSGYDMVGVGSFDVTAAVGGRVVRSQMITNRDNLTWQWGNYICIRTDAGQYHYYCHLASRAVSEGQTVKSGDKIGVMGNTGYSFGSHLHFEARCADGKTTINPETILGIPNKVGEYEIKVDELEEDINTLMQFGVISTPTYWQMNARSMQYVPELIHNMAEVLRK